jgi:CDP-glycerol glycerophosphotransferase (TagB/SpsB family)
LLKNDGRFELKFYLINTPEKEPAQMHGAEQFLKNNKVDFDVLTLEKLEDYKPHVAIIQTPYDKWHRDNEFSSKNLKKLGIRLVYIPYGTEFGGTYESIDVQFNSYFINNMWRIYTLSEVTQKYYCIYSRLTTNEVKAFGHPKFDGLYNRVCTTNSNIIEMARNKKIILVKIHFAKFFDGKMVTPDSKLYIELIDNLDKYKNCFFIFMLHPLMYDKNKNQESNVIVDKLNNCKNVYVFSEEDYREPLYVADAFICDRSSVAIEMAALDKPILYLENEINKEKYLDEFSKLFDSYYRGIGLQDIDSFIKNVVGGKDIKKKEREDKFKECVPLYDGNASSRIINDIYYGIINEKEEEDYWQK